MEEQQGEMIAQDKRVSAPSGLRVLAVLSWMGSLVSLVLLIALMFGGRSLAYACKLPLVDAMLRDDSAGGIWFILLKFVFILGSAAAVFFLWKSRKVGFWLYFGVQMILLLLPFLLIWNLGLEYILVKLLINAVFTILFILLFSFYYKILK